MEKSYQSTPIDNFLYSCGSKVQRSTEEFVEVHALGYVVSGELHFTTAHGMRIIKAGEAALVKRNQLIKATKVPPPFGEFKSISIFFEQDVLRQYSSAYNLLSSGNGGQAGVFELHSDRFVTGYFQSLLAYFETPGRMNALLAELKTKEAIELLLATKPALSEVLFDFSSLHKIDLEAFMLRHFTFNVPIDVLAKLSGRSKAGFKRDFEKIFHRPPGQWLKQKRLQEAYSLIKEKGVKPSVAYLEVGFENLSHFSYVFKQTYGINPSALMTLT